MIVGWLIDKSFERFKDTMTSSTELIALKNIEIQEHMSKITGLLDELVNL